MNRYDRDHDWTEISRSTHTITKQPVALVYCFKYKAQNVKVKP